MFTNSVEYWTEINSFSDTFTPKNPHNRTPKDYEVEYITNSFNYRSEEFKTNHNEKHVLFSGCSTTFGIGLNREEVWSDIVYNKINKKEKCSGYFNIGYPGASIYTTILDVFKYCNKFGNPDIIFINLPECFRFFDFDYKTGEYKRTKHNESEKHHTIDLINYDIYFILEQYCKTNKIKLFSFSSSYNGVISTNEMFSKYGFNTYHSLSKNFLNDNLFLLNENKDSAFFLKARDEKHLGRGFHIIMSNFIFDKYLNSQ
jgi:hypothetical protein